MPKPLTVWITTNCGKFFKGWEYQTTWPASWEICMQVKKQLLKLDIDSPMDCREIKPVNPKGNQSWIFIYWKDWCWSWSSNTLATWCKEPTHWKRPCYWERLKAGGEEDDRGWGDWMASPTRWHEFEQDPGVGEGQRSLACCGPWGRKESDTTEQLNWKV